MAKILVIDAEEKTQVPFLRGILTRSLQDAGVSFETAYSLASRIRDDLNDSTQVTTRALQALVIRRLRSIGGREEATTYSRQRRPGGRVMVEDADGYRAQAELLSVASEAVVHRALRERVSFVLEGVHVTPAFAGSIAHDADAVIETIMLAVLKPKRLRRYIRGRGRQSPRRRAERYLENFDDIWRLQDHLLDQADKAGIPIIANDDREEVFRKIMLHVIDRLSDGFAATPRDVFGEQILQAQRKQSA